MIVQQKFKRALALGLACLCCAGLSGCTRGSSGDSEQEIVFPQPPEVDGKAIYGEKIVTGPTECTLYFVSGDGTSFSTITRSLPDSQTETHCEQAVRMLLSDSSAPERASFIPSGTELRSVDFACGIATVDLSLDALQVEDDQALLRLTSSVANTLLSLEGVEGVNVLIGGRAEWVASLPAGVQTQLCESIAPVYARMNVEREYFLDSVTGTIERSAVLYFPTSGEWLVPEIREISFNSSDYASALIRALRNGPQVRSCAMAAIPENVDLLVNNPRVIISELGERVLELDFSGNLRNYLTFTGLQEWELVGSLTLTLTSFVPGIDAIRLYIDGTPLTQCDVKGTLIHFEDGLIRRDDFARCVGGTITLNVPNADGTLKAVEKSEAQKSALSPLSILNQLLSALNESDLPLSSLTDRDLLGVWVEGGIASVNLSADFYRQAQKLDEAAERGVVFAFVNTLCELNGIDGVQLFVEGISAETLAGNLHLRGILLPNPGAVVSELDAILDITATP